MNFLHTTRLTLTPLSPIHIGTGEDFEPTNYVIENGVLYGFEPSHATLPDNLRARLTSLGEKADIAGLQRFFSENKAHFIPHAKVFIPVAGGVEREYTAKLGQVVQREERGKSVFNKQHIARASYQPFNGQGYIPGSSFKGAIRTAMLDKINNGQRVTERKSIDVEKRLFEGEFATSPLRLLKIADFMPQGELARKIIFATNHKKQSVIDPATGQERQSKGVETRKEVIAHGQYRALQADVTIQDLGGHQGAKDTPKMRLPDLRELARQSNRYYRPQLVQELNLLVHRGFCHKGWYDGLVKLLNGELKAKLDTGDVFLVRLGGSGGAESKTLRGDDVSSIKIMQGKGMPAKYMSETKTVWLAADSINQRGDMYPFGWALVELDPQADLPQLQSWCVAESAQYPDMRTVREQHQADKLAAEHAKKAAIAQAEQARLAEIAREQAIREQQQAHEAKLNAMSPTQRITQTLCEQLDATPVQKQPGGDIFKTVEKVLNDALTDSAWDAAAKLFLADSVAPQLKAKGMMVGKAEKEFKRLLRELRGL
jgi:CRISPR-associated protein Csm5